MPLLACLVTVLVISSYAVIPRTRSWQSFRPATESEISTILSSCPNKQSDHQPLEERRNWADLLYMFKMYKGLLPTPFNRFFKISTNSTTRGHSAKITKAHCQLDIKRFFFFSDRVINRWNQLDQEAVDSGTVNSFKNNLERIRKSKIGFFMDHPVR